MNTVKYILTINGKIMSTGDYPSGWSASRIGKSLLKKSILESLLTMGQTAWSGDSLLTCLDTGKSYKMTSEDFVIIRPKTSLITITEV